MCSGASSTRRVSRAKPHARARAGLAYGEKRQPVDVPRRLRHRARASASPTLARFAGGVAAELRGLLSQVAKRRSDDSNAVGGRVPARTKAKSASSRSSAALRQVQEIVSELARVGDSRQRGVAELDIVVFVRFAARPLAPAVERGACRPPYRDGAEGRYGGADSRPVRSRLARARSSSDELLAQAVAATPREQQVVVTVAAAGAGEQAARRA